MRVFLAGAAGVLGRRLTPLLVAAGHSVVGTTRAADKSAILRGLGAEPVIVDVFDAEALRGAVARARPDAIIHQLTDLAFAPGAPRYQEGLARNARLRIEGTDNLVAAARAAGVRRVIAQSIAWLYAPGDGPRVETDPLVAAEGTAALTVTAIRSLENAVLAMPEGVALRYGFFYGPGTWSAERGRTPALHVDAAAQATLQALTEAAPGIYNIAEDDDSLSSEAAKRAFAFDPAFRVAG